MKVLLFWWLQNQVFYKNIQETAVEPIGLAVEHEKWADIGCSAGLISRLAQQLSYEVSGCDRDYFSIKLAKLLSYKMNNIEYLQQDFNTLNESFDVVSATSLLSVVEDKKETLNKLLSLLKNDTSVLIIIEPTKELSLKNVWKLIYDFKTLWFYKGLLLWAKARESKHIDETVFTDLDNITISHQYCLDEMVCIRYIRRENNCLK